ncbi:hypothetical protein M1116_00915 [Patescibacteria group bacterium]|nr:hypothetical protein [Patescibacteria group bacterium]
MKKDWLIFIVIVIVVFLGIKVLSKKPTTTSFDSSKAADMVLFWGDGCPHCENVRNYIKTSGIDKKLNIDQKEVYYNLANQKLMEDTAKNCPELDVSKGLAVPMAYANNKCLVGDTPIIDWLKTKSGT